MMAEKSIRQIANSDDKALVPRIVKKPAVARPPTNNDAIRANVVVP